MYYLHKYIPILHKLIHVQFLTPQELKFRLSPAALDKFSKINKLYIYFFK